jgi:hypothetical protein
LTSMSQVSKRLIDINLDGNKSVPETRNLQFGLRAPKLGTDTYIIYMYVYV